METLSAELMTHGFERFEDDPCILRLRIGDSEIIAEVFVDDIKWCSNDEQLMKSIIAKVGDKFKITIGDVRVNTTNRDMVDWTQAEISSYLGLRYSHDRSTNGKHVLKVDQTAYIDKMIEKFELVDVLTDRETPLPQMSSTDDLVKKMGGDKIYEDEKLLEWAARHSYPMIIGSLIHSLVHTRPDTAYAVAILSRAMSSPTIHHYKGARCLLLYLRATRELGIEYHQENMLKQERMVTSVADDYNPYYEAAVDASFADDQETYRSTSGFVVWFGGAPIDWECKRQPLVTMSTMESEYVAASKCVLSIRFLHKFLDFVKLKRNGPTRIHEDNAACIAIASKPVHRSRSKHIGVKFHNVREAVQNGEVILTQVWTEHMCADIFTKSPAKKDFIRCRETVMGRIPFNDMIAAHVKPLKIAPKVPGTKTVSQLIVNDNNQSWPLVTIPITEDCYAAQILGLGTFEIPGYTHDGTQDKGPEESGSDSDMLVKV